MKIAGTTLAGETSSARPATLSAEKPKPAKPRTTPAPKTISRLAISSSGGNGAVDHIGPHCAIVLRAWRPQVRGDGFARHERADGY